MTQPAQKSSTGTRGILSVIVGFLVFGAINQFADVESPFTGLIFGVLTGVAVWLATGLKR